MISSNKNEGNARGENLITVDTANCFILYDFYQVPVKHSDHRGGC